MILLEKLRELSANRAGILGKLAAFCAGLFLFWLLTLPVVNSPYFCASCHRIKSAYAGWRNSGHKKVSCTSCHGRHRGGGGFVLARMLQYPTHTGKEIWGDIPDSTCIGCHKRSEIKKVRLSGVSFEHLPHLRPFGKLPALSCTVCHSRSTRETHASVDREICFMCHIRKLPDLAWISACGTCHKQYPTSPPGGDSATLPSPPGGGSATLPSPPGGGRQEGGDGWPRIRFDHTPVQKKRVACDQCHSDVTIGSGRAHITTCRDCHSAKEISERSGDLSALHKSHLEDRRLPCRACHEKLQHTLNPDRPREQATCRSCHPDRHQAVSTMVLGETGKGLDAGAQAAHFTCENCHLTHRQVSGTGEVKTAGVEGCYSCHEEKYGRFLNRWKLSVTGTLVPLEKGLQKASEELSAKQGTFDFEKGRKHYLKALQSVTLVREGGGVHNYSYSEKVLRNAVSEINLCFEAIRFPHRVPAPPRVDLRQNDACMVCHSGLDRPRFQGLEYPHLPHVWNQGLPCKRCHGPSVRPQERKEHGRLLIALSDCRECHRSKRIPPHLEEFRAGHPLALSRSPQRGPECLGCHQKPLCRSCHEKRSPPSSHKQGSWKHEHGRAFSTGGQCSVCHQADSCAKCHKVEIPHSRIFRERAHGKAAKDGVVSAACRTCHKSSQCLACHKTPMPHPANWLAGGHGKAVARLSVHSCEKCHKGRASCVNCHRIEVPHSAQFREKEHKEVRDPAICLNCHKDSGRCQKCHVEKKVRPLSHRSRYWKTRLHKFRTGSPGEEQKCILCHGERGCVECHKTEMPHSKEFTGREGGHKREVRTFDTNTFCFNCHQTELCITCHKDKMEKQDEGK
ncbi:MAG: hypothetical protein HYU64_15610 [Armatimonadetes bacterium]|nr:hypothetical protein [Armatimonadota bacterium]